MVFAQNSITLKKNTSPYSIHFLFRGTSQKQSSHYHLFYYLESNTGQIVVTQSREHISDETRRVGLANYDALPTLTVKSEYRILHIDSRLQTSDCSQNHICLTPTHPSDLSSNVSSSRKPSLYSTSWVSLLSICSHSIRQLS